MAALVIVADQLTKSFIASNFELGAQSVPFIKNIIDITYVENEGGAWGFMQDNTWLLVALTIIIMIVCVAMLIKDGFKHKLLFFGIVLVLSGGVGNLIDRIFKGRVVDFIQFDFWRTFPVFNVADIAVTLGAALLLLYFVIDIIKDYKNKKKANDDMLNANEEKNGNSEESNIAEQKAD